MGVYSRTMLLKIDPEFYLPNIVQTPMPAEYTFQIQDLLRMRLEKAFLSCNIQTCTSIMFKWMIMLLKMDQMDSFYTFLLSNVTSSLLIPTLRDLLGIIIMIAKTLSTMRDPMWDFS